MRLGYPLLNGDANLLLYLRQIANKVNALGLGLISATDNAVPSAPTVGTYARGDFIRNSEPIELGAASSKYVVIGWMRLTNGSANVLNTDWVACRCFTGN
jgi:hypothetical protein